MHTALIYIMKTLINFLRLGPLKVFFIMQMVLVINGCCPIKTFHVAFCKLGKKQQCLSKTFFTFFVSVIEFKMKLFEMIFGKKSQFPLC